METKSLKKQLMAAIAMVVVAAVALSSATYAWFANNNKVTADGMTINAKIEGTMLIIAETVDDLYDGDQARKTSVKVTEGVATDLYPTHPIFADLAEELEQWNHNYSDNYTLAISGDSEETEVAEDAYDDYFLVKTLAIGLDDTNTDASASDLILSGCTIEYADGVDEEYQTDLINCARVLITDEAGNVLGVYGSGEVMTAQGTASTADTMATLTTGATGNSPVLADALTAGSTGAKLFNVYLYFDGRDVDCTSAKFSAAKVDIELEFTATIE